MFWVSSVSTPIFLSFLSSKEFILQNALLTLQSASCHKSKGFRDEEGEKSRISLFFGLFMCEVIENIMTGGRKGTMQGQ